MAEHAFTEGTHLVRLTVVDDEGKADRASQQVVSQGTPPISDPGGPYLVGEDDAQEQTWSARLDGSASSDPESGIVQWEWDANASDGIQVDATGPTPLLFYPAAGDYTTTLTVTNGAEQRTSATVIVTVTGGDDPVAGLSGPTSLDESAADNGVWTGAYDLGSSFDDSAIARFDVNRMNTTSKKAVTNPPSLPERRW
jgi:PKD repeat protein